MLLKNDGDLKTVYSISLNEYTDEFDEGITPDEEESFFPSLPNFPYRPEQNDSFINDDLKQDIEDMLSKEEQSDFEDILDDLLSQEEQEEK